MYKSSSAKSEVSFTPELSGGHPTGCSTEGSTGQPKVSSVSNQRLFRQTKGLFGWSTRGFTGKFTRFLTRGSSVWNPRGFIRFLNQRLYWSIQRFVQLDPEICLVESRGFTGWSRVSSGSTKGLFLPEVCPVRSRWSRDLLDPEVIRLIQRFFWNPVVFTESKGLLDPKDFTGYSVTSQNITNQISLF